MRWRALCLFAVLALASASATGQGQGVATAAEWRTFTGSWSAVGQRQTLPTEHGTDAAVVQLSGTLLLSNVQGLSRGFRAEVIGFDDGAAASTGRAVWTDGRGDRVFSTIRGERVAAGKRITGTLTGGTGRYQRVIGDYTFTWQYVVSEGDTIQGRAADLAGRVRQGEAGR
jgi:hypothetical protein